MIELKYGDCLEIMSYINDKSINLVLCDLPYGTTASNWDKTIPMKYLWEHYANILGRCLQPLFIFGTKNGNVKLVMPK